MALSRFAGLWLRGGSGLWNLTTTPAALNTWNHANNGHGGIEATVNNGQIIIKKPGYYIGYCSISFTVTAGSIIYAEFYVNGVPGAGFRAQAEGIASGGPVNLFLMGGSDLNENDVVQVYVSSDQAGGTNFIHVDGQFGVISV